MGGWSCWEYDLHLEEEEQLRHCRTAVLAALAALPELRVLQVGARLVEDDDGLPSELGDDDEAREALGRLAALRALRVRGRIPSRALAVLAALPELKEVHALVARLAPSGDEQREARFEAAVEDFKSRRPDVDTALHSL